MSKAEKLQKFFLNQVDVLLGYVEFDKLQKSYSTDMEYAKSLFHSMHDTFERVYKTDCVDDEMEFVTVPAVIVGKNTGELCIGLVTLDTESAGEHWMTTFLTKHGATNQGEWKSDEALFFIRENYLPYDYFYTVKYDGDIHINPADMPDKVTALMPPDGGQSMQLQ